MTGERDLMDAMLAACAGVLEGVTTDGVQPSFAVVLWPTGNPDGALLGGARPVMAADNDEVIEAVRNAADTATNPTIGRIGERKQ